jgi:hypothetical protein
MFISIFAIECRRIKPYSAIICCRDSFANPLLQDAHNAILRTRKKDSTPLLPALMGLSIGQLNQREVAAPVGVGPFNRDDGRMRSKRATLSTSRLVHGRTSRRATQSNPARLLSAVACCR